MKPVMNQGIDRKRLSLFLGLAFGISWISALVIYLTGGLVASPELIPGTGITLALVLLSSVYMWGPALAHILTRIITKEGWEDAFLRPNFKKAWVYWLIGWFGPGLLTIAGAALFFILFPMNFDGSLDFVKNQLDAMGAAGEIFTPIQYALMQAGIALLISALVNLVATFGEEFGWRGYLLPKLQPLGSVRSLLLSGVIWGVWHWPVIAMGHNYGLDYPGFPWLGMLATIWVMVSIGVFFGWLSMKAGSVWPAALAHGALNGMAAIGLLFAKGELSMLVGPTPAGMVGCLPFTIISILILTSANKKGQQESIKD